MWKLRFDSQQGHTTGPTKLRNHRESIRGRSDVYLFVQSISLFSADLERFLEDKFVCRLLDSCKDMCSQSCAQFMCSQTCGQ